MTPKTHRPSSVMILFALALGWAGVLFSFKSAFASCANPANAIEAENCHPGTPASVWDVAVEDPNLQGFATQISVNKGETARFKVKTDAARYRIEIYRLGYYQGNGARRMAALLRNSPQTQPPCIDDTSTGLYDCGNWAESFNWVVPSTATSGVYVAKLVREPENGRSHHILFVVRDDNGGSDVLFQTSDATWQAYEMFGGSSFYGGRASPGPTPPVPPLYHSGRAAKLSYNRPFTNGITFFNFEYPMLRWLERNGYDVSYFTNVDSAQRGAEMLEHKLFLSVGHDEYWSDGQRTNVENARNAGVHLGFFSGNQVYWKTRWENSADGSNQPFRTLVCYKEPFDGFDDPSSEWTGQWQTFPSTRPENSLTGTAYNYVMNQSPMSIPSRFGKLRFWRNTSIAALPDGSSAVIGGSALGYEWDEDLDNGHRPPGLIRLSSSTILVAGDFNPPELRTHHMTLYRHPSGALVFGSGSIQTHWGLDGSGFRGYPWFEDNRLKQAVVNLFADMTVQPGSLEPVLVPAMASTDLQPPSAFIQTENVPVGQLSFISGTASDAAGQVGGVEYSLDGAAYHPANGFENWTFSFTPELPGLKTIYIRTTDDSGNSGVTSKAISVSAGPTCEATGIQAVPSTGTVINGTVQLSASASCTAGGVPEFQWMARNPSGTWTQIQSYIGSGSIQWKPALTQNAWNPGNYQIQVLVKDRTSISSQSVANLNSYPLTEIPLGVPKTLYSDGEDGATAGWSIYADVGGAASITNVFDSESQSRAIQLSGAGWYSGYRLGKSDGSNWNNETQFIADWSVKYSSDSVFYFSLQTTAGPMFLQYNSRGSTATGGEYNVIALGSDMENGQWHRVVRNLQTDLSSLRPGVTITRVDELLMRGSGRIDNLYLRAASTGTAAPSAPECQVASLLANPSTGTVINGSVQLSASASCNAGGIPEFQWRVRNPSGTWTEIQGYSDLSALSWMPALTHNSWNPGTYQVQVSVKDKAAISSQGASSVNIPLSPIPFSASGTLYEDAEDGTASGWSIYADVGSAATIANVFDSESQSRAIELSGAGWYSGYRLGKSDGSNWDNGGEFIADWSVKYSSDSTFYFSLQTSAGPMFMQYNSRGSTVTGGEYNVISLGSDMENGQWHRVVRNLQTDLSSLRPGVTITRVDELLMRGSGRLDNIYLRSVSTGAQVPMDSAAPSVPVGLTALAVSTAQINLSWTASSDNVGVSGYRVFRNGVQVATPTAITYSDGGLVPGATYSYNIAAFDAALNVSSLSVTVTTRTLPIPPASGTNEVIGLVRRNCEGYSNCYPSLAAWESAFGGVSFGTCAVGNLTCVKKTAVAQIDGVWIAADTAPVTINGWTTNSTYYIKIYAAPAARHAGKWNTAAYRLESAQTPLTINEENVMVDGLQVRMTDTTRASWRRGIHVSLASAAGNILISNSLVRANANIGRNGAGILFDATGANSRFYVLNSAVYGFRTNNDYAAGVRTLAAGWTGYVYGSVLNNNDYGIRNNGGAITAKNSYAGGNRHSAYNGTIGKTRSASSDGTGSPGLLNVAYSVNAGARFTNITLGSEDFHIKTQSVLKDAGVNTSTEPAPLNYSGDIDGGIRTGTWDIGADEFGVSGPSGASVLGALELDEEAAPESILPSIFVDPSFRLGEVYAFPNPTTAGHRPTFHIECGLADSVSLRIYNIAGELVHDANFPAQPLVIDDKYAYEYAWSDASAASGVYIYSITAVKGGEVPIKIVKKFAIVK